MTYAEPEATSHSYALLEFEPHSKPAGREASGTIWQGLVYGQRAAVKVGHPDSPDAITELHTEAHFYSEHTELQGCCIPCLLGQGGIQFDDEETPAEWLATSLEGPAPSSLQSLTDAIMAAKQALVEYHASGAQRFVMGQHCVEPCFLLCFCCVAILVITKLGYDHDCLHTV